MVNAACEHSAANGSPGLERKLEIEFSGLRPGSTVNVTSRRIDNAHAGAYEVWKRLGSPASPSELQHAELTAADRFEVQVLGALAVDPAGRLRLSFRLPMPGIVLFEIASPDTPADPKVINANFE